MCSEGCYHQGMVCLLTVPAAAPHSLFPWVSSCAHPACACPLMSPGCPWCPGCSVHVPASSVGSSLYVNLSVHQTGDFHGIPEGGAVRSRKQSCPFVGLSEGEGQTAFLPRCVGKAGLSLSPLWASSQYHLLGGAELVMPHCPHCGASPASWGVSALTTAHPAFLGVHGP
jgi:hypothetical protein